MLAFAASDVESLPAAGTRRSDDWVERQVRVLDESDEGRLHFGRLQKHAVTTLS
jgi:hypothetical protein